jgi:hypothetical protein
MMMGQYKPECFRVIFAVILHRIAVVVHVIGIDLLGSDTDTFMNPLQFA